MENLVYLLKLTQEELKIVVYNYLIEKQMSPVFEDGFVYAKGNIPILLVAHMDTILDAPPKQIYYDENKDEMFSLNGGIGGDDRCGVYAIMKILERLKPHVLFTEDEEIGVVGASKTVKKLLKPDIKYIIEFDRRGSNDCVFYDCGNEEFINYIESFGFITEYGTFSDISVLSSAWDIAAVNLSSGYYNEHTYKEYIKFKELQHNINRVELMLKKHKTAKFFEYQEIKYIPQRESLLINEDFILWLQKIYSLKKTSDNEIETKKLTFRKKDKNEGKGDK